MFAHGNVLSDRCSDMQRLYSEEIFGNLFSDENKRDA